MIQIKKIKQKDYLIMDAILVILNNKPQLSIGKLQYEILKCGIHVGQPLLREAIKRLKEDKLIGDVMDLALN